MVLNFCPVSWFISKPKIETWRCCGQERDKAQSPLSSSNPPYTPNSDPLSTPLGYTSEEVFQRRPQEFRCVKLNTFPPNCIKLFS